MNINPFKCHKLVQLNGLVEVFKVVNIIIRIAAVANKHICNIYIALREHLIKFVKQNKTLLYSQIIVPSFKEFQKKFHLKSFNNAGYYLYAVMHMCDTSRKQIKSHSVWERAMGIITNITNWKGNTNITEKDTINYKKTNLKKAYFIQIAGEQFLDIFQIFQFTESEMNKLKFLGLLNPLLDHSLNDILTDLLYHTGQENTAKQLQMATEDDKIDKLYSYINKAEHTIW
eukprot:502072_1